jgi:hypothetical protein
MAEPTLDQLKRARATMAELIQAHGEKYWPLFQRLDEACRDRESRAKRLADAMALPDIFVTPSGQKAGDQVIGKR